APPPLRLPLLGELDPAGLSLPALTLILAGLDAFNPCAFFVLLFLLSMMAHQKSRARMLAIGGVFVLVSGLMYFAFMAAWLNVFQLFGHLAWVTLAAGALAVFVGLVNVKDFFLFEQGLTLSIPASRKPDLFRRARAILNAEHLPAMLGATLFLAIAANFYELLCTAGFPMVYTRLLTLADLPATARYGYLAAYNLIYVVPLALIVVLFARTLGARKLTEREGRLLKLMSGLMMLGLGALLLFAPQLVSRVGIAFGLMAVAVGLTWLAARLTREASA
ncbi:MAG: cytochrome c bioproteinis protein transmembrane region, partial [bacterium]